jgi:alkylation response protein AidB-like acyl-CoA dehydrogenase
VKATPLEHGAYRFDGHKILTSLAPAWDWLGVHGLNSSDPDAPKIVHAFIRRTDPGHRTVETWDALGVRSTRSDDTILEGVVANREHVTRILPAGPPVDPFIDGIFGSVMPGLAAVYYGIARRSFDLAVEEAKNRRSLALGGKPSTHSAFVQQSTAEAAIELDSIQALIERVADDWWNGVDHGDQWPAKLLAAKQHAVDGALRVVNLSLKIAGARSLSRRHELERLYRDVRAGAFHPPNTDAAHEIIGRTYLGVLGAA